VNHGSLALRDGVLYVARGDVTARVRPYDLAGRPLGPGFELRGAQGEPVALGGIDVDADRQVWVADAATNRVRTFSVFGRESGGLAGADTRRDDARGALRAVTDVAVVESDDARLMLVASGGWRRHALQAFDANGACVESLRPNGSPLARFRGLTRIAARDGFVFACDAPAGVVQVFRSLEFHFAFRVAMRPGAKFEPVAIAPLTGGRSVVAVRGEHAALLLVDGAGRLQRVLADRGSAAGEVDEPADVAVEASDGDRGARLAVIDRDGERVQVFTLEGRCEGELTELPGRASGAWE
jgi:hypothetical protein